MSRGPNRHKTQKTMNNSWKLAALLLIAMTALLGYAFLPTGVAGTLHLKQIALAPQAATTELLVEADSAETVAEPVDTTSQRILLFGDSMAELLALRFADYANANGHELTCVSWYSSSTRQWAETDTLDHYMRTVRPTLVLISLGSNELYTRDMKRCERHARAILDRIGGVPAIWIGPPNWCEDFGINQQLLDIMGPNAFYPSLNLTFERQKDGRHPTPAAARVWVDKIVEWMTSGHAIHPIRLDKPQKRNAQCQRFIITASGARKKDGHRQAADSLGTATKATHEAPAATEAPAPETPVAHSDTLKK